MQYFFKYNKLLFGAIVSGWPPTSWSSQGISRVDSKHSQQQGQARCFERIPAERVAQPLCRFYWRRRRSCFCPCSAKSRTYLNQGHCDPLEFNRINAFTMLESAVFYCSCASDVLQCSSNFGWWVEMWESDGDRKFYTTSFQLSYILYVFRLKSSPRWKWYRSILKEIPIPLCV